MANTAPRVSAAERPRAWPRLGLVGLALTPVIVLIVCALMFVSLRAADAQQQALQHSFETREQIQRLFSLLQDGETGQRGYVITGNRSFLEPYDRAVSQLDEKLSRVDALVGRDPAQLARLNAVRRLIASKRSEMARVIQVRETQGRDAAAARVSNAIGKRLMDEIRVVMSEMDRAESRHVAQSMALSELRAAQVRWTAAALSLVLGLTLGGSLWVMFRQGRARQRLIQHLEQLTVRQAAIFESAIDGIVTLNPSGTIETINPAASRMFGYEPGTLARSDISRLVDLGPEEGLFLRRLARGGRRRFEGVRTFTARRADGSTFQVEVALGAMPLKDGVHVVAAVRDITDRLEAERLKDEFVSTVSHELRTPLTSIAGSLGLIAGGAAGALPPKAERLVTIAKSSSDRLVRLINDLLDLQKMGAGRLVMQRLPLDLETVARAAVQATAAIATERQVRVAVSGEGLPVQGDPDRLEQVLVNLISNALKFSPGGSLVEVRLEREEGRARVCIRDRGPGVPEAFQPHLFSRFSQADGSATRAIGGSGLGLAISREIAERHGGRVYLAESGPSGAEFRLELPVAALDHRDRPLAVLGQADPALRDELTPLLQRAGYRVETAADLSGLPDDARLLLVEHAGPASVAELRELAASGVTLPPTVLVARGPTSDGEGFPVVEWITAHDFLDQLWTALRRDLPPPGAPWCCTLRMTSSSRSSWRRSSASPPRWRPSTAWPERGRG